VVVLGCQSARKKPWGDWQNPSARIISSNPAKINFLFHIILLKYLNKGSRPIGKDKYYYRPATWFN